MLTLWLLIFLLCDNYFVLLYCCRYRCRRRRSSSSRARWERPWSCDPLLQVFALQSTQSTVKWHE